MVGIKNKILFGFMLCLMALAFWGCPHQTCVKNQDIAKVIKANESYTYIDSIIMIANDSITGCGKPKYGMGIGSKTHNVKFPIDVRIQLFSQGSLLKERSFEMPKNTVLRIYGSYECSGTLSFRDRMESAKKHKRFIDSHSADDYCWLLEKIDSDDEDRCTETGVGDIVDDLCYAGSWL